MNLYEKIIILDPNREDTVADETVAKIKDVIINKGGEILKTEKWGRRKLAYELSKHQKGNYILLLFKSPPSAIAELEKFCKVTDSVIKFMVVKLTKKKQIETIMPSLTESESRQQPEDTAPGTEGVETTNENPATEEERENV